MIIETYRAEIGDLQVVARNDIESIALHGPDGFVVWLSRSEVDELADCLQKARYFSK